MNQPLQPKPNSRNPRQLQQRLDMLANGWVPIPCEAKGVMPNGWTKFQVDAAAIEDWDANGCRCGEQQPHRKFKGTGIRIEGTAFVLDLDIKDQVLMNKVLDAIEGRFPDWLHGVLWRHSGGQSWGLFSQVSEQTGPRPVKSRNSRHFGRLAEDGTVSEDTHIEVHTGLGNGSRYFAVSGPHKERKRQYLFDGPGPWDVRLDSLPVFPGNRIGELIDLIEDVFKQHGLSAITEGGETGNKTSVYDLTPETKFKAHRGDIVTLAELEAMLDIGTEGQRGVLEFDWLDASGIKTKSDGGDRHHAFRRDRNGRLCVTDHFRNVNHYYVDESPTTFDPEVLAAALRSIDETDAEDDDNTEESPPPPVEGTVQRLPVIRYIDLIGHSPSGKFIYRLTGELWPSATVDKRLPKVRLNAVGEDGKPIKLAASTFIMKTAVVEQMSWEPGEGEIIEDRVAREGGYVFKEGARTYNLYRPPAIISGDRRQAGRWVDHVYTVYGDDDACRIIDFLGHTVQFPGIKINHALLMGGAQGIGKDTILAPLRTALGDWNIAEVRPPDLFEKFNKWQRTVVLRVNEMHDLGDESIYALYERMKPLTAAPPEMLEVNEKYLGGYYIKNVVKVIMTTNYKENGIYLPADDRRHYVAWSELLPNQPGEAYFNELHDWLNNGGNGHVAAYLRQLDLAGFNPMAPPPKTEAFWAIVNANRSSTDVGIGDILEGLKKADGGLPGILTISDLRDGALKLHLHEAYAWLADIRHRRQIPSTLVRHGYIEVPNPSATDRRWTLEGRKQSIYRLNTLSLHEAIREVERRMAGSEREK